MRIYNIYTKDGFLKISTFDEDKAWEILDLNAGDSIDVISS